MMKKILVFGKAQVSAFIGGVTDYLVMILLTDIANIHYTLSIIAGGFIGAVVNFSLNRAWAFHSRSSPYSSRLSAQLFKFSLMVLGSVGLKSSGTFFITSFLGLNYKISRALVDLSVSYGFNYPISRYWVFKHRRSAKEQLLLFI